MPYSRKVPNNRVEPLAWLGKTNWITPTKDGYRWSRDDIQGILDRSLQYGRNFAYEVRDIINLSVFEQTSVGLRPARQTLYSNIFFMASKVLATGQKTIQLSQEWCEAFENTGLTLQFKDYRQPFPTMVIELPANYAEAKFVPGAGDYPEFVAVHHEEGERILLFEIVFHHSQMTTLLPYRLDSEIESTLDGFGIGTGDDVGFDTAGTEGFLIPFLRIALNAIVAMTYGTEWQKLEPTRNEQQTVKNLKKQIHGKNTKHSNDAAKAKLRFGAMPEIFQFDQKIKAFEDHRSDSNTGSEQNGTPKKTHWRRGHWRWQAVGHGRTQHELRWIRPMLINSHQFKGDLKDTTATYTAS